jgi:replicative DNA helicase
VQRDDHRQVRQVTVTEAIGELDQRLRAGSVSGARTLATGFSILDEVLGGGLHAGELLLIGGPPGVGKTIAALQWARNLARTGTRVVYACYEHDPTALLLRLLALEAGELGGARDLSLAIERTLGSGRAMTGGIGDLAAAAGPVGEAALTALQGYADDLVLVRASGAHTDLGAVRDLAGGERPAGALLIDYLQKIPVQPEPATEAEKVTRTVEGLKDLALDLAIPVVALSAVDADGMRASRIRLYHLRGSSAVAFEADVVLVFNDKMKAVSKVHLSYDAVRSRTFRDWVVVSIEKNRGGPNLVDLEFRKDFSHFRFEPEGAIVTDKLVDERLDEEMV